MTKKTTEIVGGAAEASTDTTNLVATLPDSLVQPATAVTLEHPTTGGSFLRQADGSLVHNPDAATADKAEEPKCHFDGQPQGGEAVA